MSFEPGSGAGAPLGVPMSVRVDGLDLTSDNAFAERGHGFRLRARSRRLTGCPAGFAPSLAMPNLCAGFAIAPAFASHPYIHEMPQM